MPYRYFNPEQSSLALGDGTKRQEVFPRRSEPAALVQQLRVLIRYRSTIVTFAALAMGAALLFSLLTHPKYEARTRVALDFSTPDVLTSDRTNVPDGSDEPTKLQTQLNIAQSDSVAEDVIRQLRLAGRCGFAAKGCSAKGKDFDALDVESQADALAAYHNGLSINVVPKTQILEIRFRSTDPRLAAKIVDVVANTYIDHTFRTRSASIQKTSEWLNTQLEEVKKNAEDAQARLDSYEEKAGIVGMDQNHNIVMDRLDDLNRQMASVESDRILKEARYRVALSGNPELITTVMPESVIAVLRKQQADLQLEYGQLSAKFGENYPKVIQLRSQLDDMSKQIDTEIGAIRQRMHEEYQAAQQSENMLQATMNKQKSDALHMNQAAVQYAVLEKDVQASRDLYENLVRKLKEAGIEQGLRSSNIDIIDTAQIPAHPVSPNLPLNLALGLLSGVICGIAVAFIRDTANRFIRTPEDIEMQCMLPALGIVPRLSLKSRTGQASSSLLKPPQGVLPITLDRPESQEAEAYRMLRTALLSPREADPRVICVVSGRGQEGKSTTAINTAIVLAQQGSRVLLVDADMRCPTIHSQLNLTMTIGLSECLAGSKQPEEAILPVPDLSLFVMPAGSRPRYTSELLSSPKMKALLRSWKREYDFVIIDTPPLLAFTDGVLVAGQADATVIVVRSTTTPTETLQHVRQLLDRANAKITGVLLNDKRFDATEHDSYYDAEAYARYERSVRLGA